MNITGTDTGDIFHCKKIDQLWTPSSSESIRQAETISHRVRMVEHEIRFLVGLPVGFGRRSKQDFPRTILCEGHVERRSSQLLDKSCVNWRDTNNLMGTARR